LDWQCTPAQRAFILDEGRRPFASAEPSLYLTVNFALAIFVKARAVPCTWFGIGLKVMVRVSAMPVPSSVIVCVAGLPFSAFP
jgi:hypothetical protein